MIRSMHEALVEARVSLGKMRDGIAVTERKLSAERESLADAERRGRLAADIGDHETQEVAERFAAKHQDRVAILERKLAAQRDELALAEREVGEMRTQLDAARANRPHDEATARIESAWRDLEAAGGVRPETDVNDELLRSKFDRATREAAAEAKLRELKKKMGR
jgi:hypothetical protein